MNSNHIRQQTLASITERYEAQASRTLRDFMIAPEIFEQVDSQQIVFLWEHRREVLRDFAQPDTPSFLCDACLNATLRYTYHRNQFLNFSDDYLALLAQVYQRLFSHLLDMLQTATSMDKFSVGFREIVRQHHARLRTLFGAYCQALHPAAFAEHPFLESVCCGEYSAPLQLRLLRVELESLREPILDLGCGSRGEVVTYLRQQGFHAIGLDRLSPELPGFVQADWFGVDFQQNTWGTILAHQSFSTHFLHSHQHAPRQAERYAKTYLAILQSLQSGGIFHYTPGLPFFEPHIRSLPDYRLETRLIDAPNIPESIRAISYAVIIKKREYS
ncbi:hypothetical protein U14_04845 [Candidatus Moduliflexus flocculans]|uniref:Uncharacterized protein n=1 Tax=Candidatus Moduliflexus flocculans TaxID=1499966 RepID=A0A0S6W4Y7_9BACT|nr:hypothetical protein U14_04845 [Candidatus Moduliflexus flocculans]